MNALGAVIAMVLGVVAGVVVIGALAEHQLGAEAASIGTRLGVPAGNGGAGRVLSFLDRVDPGASTRLMTAALTTAVGGAAAAVVVHAIAREVLS